MIQIFGNVVRCVSDLSDDQYLFERKDLKAGVYFLSISNRRGERGFVKIILN